MSKFCMITVPCRNVFSITCILTHTREIYIQICIICCQYASKMMPVAGVCWKFHDLIIMLSSSDLSRLGSKKRKTKQKATWKVSTKEAVDLVIP